MTHKIENLDQKFADFDHFEGSFLAILVVEKDVFWTFSKLFWKGFWASFLMLKGPLLNVFLAVRYTICYIYLLLSVGNREALRNVDKASSGLVVGSKFHQPHDICIYCADGWADGSYVLSK